MGLRWILHPCRSILPLSLALAVCPAAGVTGIPLDPAASARNRDGGLSTVAMDTGEEADALRYDLRIRIFPDRGEIIGEATIDLRAVNDLEAVLLDLAEGMEVASVRDSAGTVLDFERPGSDRLLIRFPSTIRTDEDTRVRILYTGMPGESYFSGHTFFDHHGAGADSFPMVSTLSQPNGSSKWWPCRDRMDDKAIVTLGVETPEGYVVASNGTLVSEETLVDGWKRTTWRSSYPTSPYLIAFAATNYATWAETYTGADGESIPLRFYAYPEDSSDARVDWSPTGAILRAYEDRFGPYPFRNPAIAREKLGVAEFSWPSGAMEHQTCVFMGEGFVSGRRLSDWALAHEISHQWWGDAVTPVDMDHIWLNEGFATYCEALYEESKGGLPAYLDYMQSRRVPPAFERNSPLVRPNDWFSLADVYLRGAWVLHMLRGQIGDGEFFEAMNVYYGRYAYGNAETDDFVRAVEETAGEDLRWFFIPWLYGTGRPEIVWDWWSEPQMAGAHRVRLFLQQTQDGPTYPKGSPVESPQDYFSFWIDVRLTGDSGQVDRRVFVDSRSHVAVLDVPFEPTSVELDPSQWLLREIREAGDGVSEATVQVYPNPIRAHGTLLVRGSSAGDTRVTVHEVGGRVVRDLGRVAGDGFHLIPWDGRNGRGEPVSSGMYFVRTDGPRGQGGARVSLIR